MCRCGNDRNNIGYTFSGFLIILMLFIPLGFLFLIYWVTIGSNGVGIILLAFLVIIGAIIYFTTEFIKSKIEKNVEKTMVDMLNKLDK